MVTAEFCQGIDRLLPDRGGIAADSYLSRAGCLRRICGRVPVVGLFMPDSDSTTSDALQRGVPNEKLTWGKLEAATAPACD